MSQQEAPNLNHLECIIREQLDQIRASVRPNAPDVQGLELGDFSWPWLFQNLPDHQKQRQREIYRRLLETEETKNLTQEQRLAVANAADKAWQGERRRMLSEIVSMPSSFGHTWEAERVKIAANLTPLLRALNLGEFTAKTLTEMVYTNQKSGRDGAAGSLARRLCEFVLVKPVVNLRSAGLAVVIAFFVGVLMYYWLGERYRVLPVGNGFVIKVDRWTGQTWRCHGSQGLWVPINSSQSQ